MSARFAATVLLFIVSALVLQGIITGNLPDIQEAPRVEIPTLSTNATDNVVLRVLGQVVNTVTKTVEFIVTVLFVAVWAASFIALWVAWPLDGLPVFFRIPLIVGTVAGLAWSIAALVRGSG